MSKNNSTALKVAATLNFVLSGVILFASLAIVCNWFGASEFYQNILIETMGGSESIGWQKTYKFMFLLEGLFACAINTYAGVMYLRFALRKQANSGVAKFLSYLALIQFLCTSNLISAIIAFVVSGNLKQNIPTKIKLPENMGVEQQIKLIKKQLENGEISQEEYDEKLNKILEDSVKQNLEDKRG